MGAPTRPRASRSHDEQASVLFLTGGLVLAGSLGQLLLCLAMERVLVVL